MITANAIACVISEIVMPTARASMLVATARTRTTAEVRRVRRFSFLFDFERFVNHLKPHRGQNPEGNPVVVIRYVLPHSKPRQITDNGHKRLKPAEEARHSKRMTDVQLFIRRAGND